MPILACCPRPSSLATASQQPRHGHQRSVHKKPSTPNGFTLIEILVVMVVIGLLAGVALPRLYDLARRFEIAAQKDAMLLAIGNLSYRAYQTGQALQLGAPANSPLADSSAATAAPLTVAPGWRLEVPKTIHYSFNGICSGGTLTLQDPDAYRAQYTLAPPLCRPIASADVGRP